MPIIGHFGRHNLVSVQILPYFKPIRDISEVDIYGINFAAIYKKMLSELRQRENMSIESGRRSAILNLIMLKFLMVYPYLKLHILLYSNGPAIWFSFPDITYTCITKIMAYNLPFRPP